MLYEPGMVIHVQGVTRILLDVAQHADYQPEKVLYFPTEASFPGSSSLRKYFRHVFRYEKNIEYLLHGRLFGTPEPHLAFDEGVYPSERPSVGTPVS